MKNEKTKPGSGVHSPVRQNQKVTCHARGYPNRCQLTAWALGAESHMVRNRLEERSETTLISTCEITCKIGRKMKPGGLVRTKSPHELRGPSGRKARENCEKRGCLPNGEKGGLKRQRGALGLATKEEYPASQKNVQGDEEWRVRGALNQTKIVEMRKPGGDPLRVNDGWTKRSEKRHD